MIAIVCGGRNFSDTKKLFDSLDKISKDRGLTKIINGAQSGADELSTEWGHSRGIPVQEFEAQWDIYGKSAGPIRNQVMLDSGIDLVIAFKGGKGTRDMVSKALAKGVEVIKVE